MRECIAGFYKNNYAKDLLTLLLFLLLAFFIGLVLRPLLMNLNHLFDKRLAETDRLQSLPPTAYTDDENHDAGRRRTG